MGAQPYLIRSFPKSLILVISLGLLLGFTGIWWGVVPGSPEDWASDTILPRDVFQATSHGFQNGWYTRYPPFHYEVLSALYSPFYVLHYLNFLDIKSYPTYTILLLLSRVLTLIMAIIMVILVYMWARALGVTEGGATFAAALTTLNPMFAYYSKTTNLDLPYTMWFIASMLYLTWAIKSNKLRDYILFTIFATFAIGTKDQAYGLYVLIVPVVVYSLYSDANRQSARSFEAGIRVARKLLVLAVIAGGLFSAIYLLPINLDGFTNHVKLIIGPASSNYRIYSNSVSGHWSMLVTSFRQIGFAFGWWMCIISGLGLIWKLSRKPMNRLILLPVLSVISYYLFYISVVGYNYDRFFLPVLACLSIYGGILLSGLWYQSRFPKPITLFFILALLAYSLFNAGSVDMMMIADSRYKALKWLQAQVGPGELVSGVGDSYYLPPLNSFRTSLLGRKPSIELVRVMDPNYIVVSSIFDQDIFQTQTDGYQFFASLKNGELGYELVFQYQGKPVFNRLNLENIVTNLDKINPEIQIYRGIH